MDKNNGKKVEERMIIVKGFQLRNPFILPAIEGKFDSWFNNKKVMPDPLSLPLRTLNAEPEQMYFHVRIFSSIFYRNI